MTDSNNSRAPTTPPDESEAPSSEEAVNWDDEPTPEEVAEQNYGPYLDFLFRSAAPRIKSFPQAFVGVIEGADWQVPQDQFWRFPYELAPDYFVRTPWRSPSDTWVNVRGLNIEAVDEWRPRAASWMVKRHRQVISLNTKGNLYLQQVVVVMGPKRPPAGAGVRCETAPDGTPIYERVMHISDLRKSYFSAADQQLAILNILAILFGDGQDQESVDWAMHLVAQITDPDERRYHIQAFIALKYGRPEYSDMVDVAFNKEYQKMTEVQRQAFERDYTEATEDGLIFKPRVDALRAAMNRERGREEGEQKRHVDCLLQALRHNRIELEPEDRAALRSLRCAKLPSIAVAMDAEDAEDFLRRAGIHRR